MSWIETIPYAEATGKLRRLYDRVRAPDGQIDNVIHIHSLRPHTMEGHMALYKNVLHHSANTLPTWFLEMVGVYVSILNGCDYCAEHHAVGLRRAMEDSRRATAIVRALRGHDASEWALGPREQAALTYAYKLTMSPAEMRESDVAAMRAAGFDDGEILEINQVAAYFAYANRTVVGLGVTADGEVLGLAPRGSGDAEDWTHS